MSKKTGLTEAQLFLLPGTAVFNALIYNGGRALGAAYPSHSLSVWLDSRIPFSPVTVMIYWGCIVFWIVNYYLGARYDTGRGYRFLCAHFIGETVCFLLFAFFPTTMSRPEITGSSISERILSLTYRLDEANNLFPSVHCFVSWLAFIAVRNNRHIPVWYRAVSLGMALAVCISTLTVKQHVIADTVAGIALAELSYLISAVPDRFLNRNKLDSVCIIYSDD